MKQHKWAKEIKAWADGAEIETRFLYAQVEQTWKTTNAPNFYDLQWEFRIKPQPKEPQYLYVWVNQVTGYHKLSDIEPHPLKEYASVGWKCKGKIKLETEDE